MAISADTYRLVEGYFTLEDLGRHTLKGVAAPLQVYRVLCHSGAQSRLDVAGPRGLTPEDDPQPVVMVAGVGIKRSNLVYIGGEVYPI